MLVGFHVVPASIHKGHRGYFGDIGRVGHIENAHQGVDANQGILAAVRGGVAPAIGIAGLGIVIDIGDQGGIIILRPRQGNQDQQGKSG